MIALTHYLTVDGFDPFQAWLNRLKRRDPQALLRVLTRLNRLAFGHAGDSKALGRGCTNRGCTTARDTGSITDRRMSGS